MAENQDAEQQSSSGTNFRRAKRWPLIVGGFVIAAATIPTIVTHISPDIAIIAGLLCGALAVISVRFPLHRLGLSHWAFSLGVLVVAVMTLIAGLNRQVVAENDRLVALRENNPAQYLAELQTRDPAKWLVELQTLDPSAYQLEMKRREEERQAKAREEVAAKERTRAKEQARATEEAAAKERARVKEQWDHPENHLKLENVTWYTEAFNTVMVLNVTIINPLPFRVKDIEIRCQHYANSGTNIDSNTRTIYEIVPARGKRQFKEFNMGFIHSQASRTSCNIRTAVAVDR